MLLTCILYCDAGPGCLIRTVARTVCFSHHGLGSQILYLSLSGFIRDCCSFTSRKLYLCLRDVLMFLGSIWSSFCLLSLIFRFIPPLFVLAPHDSNVAIYVQVSDLPWPVGRETNASLPHKKTEQRSCLWFRKAWNVTDVNFLESRFCGFFEDFVWKRSSCHCRSTINNIPWVQK